MPDLGATDAPIEGLPYEANLVRVLTVDSPLGVVVQYVTAALPAIPPAPSASVYQLGASSLAGVEGDFGSDVLVFPSFDGNLTLVEDGRVIAEAVARRLSTKRGTMPFHPDYGLDLRDYLNEAVTPDVLYRLKAAVELECEQDERVQSATATITYSLATQQLRVAIEVVTNTENLRFVLSVSQVSVELLEE